MARITFPSPQDMSPEQLDVYQTIVSGPRGRMVGPLRAAIHNPELAASWQALGSVLRYKTSLPAQLSELAILVTARRWNSVVEWSIHKGEALKAGLDLAIIDAIAQGELPVFSDPAQRDIYEFSRQLVSGGEADASVYQAVSTRWNDVGVVELTALVGYYSMVAMTLNAHQIPLPEGVSNELPTTTNGQLFQLPAAN